MKLSRFTLLPLICYFLFSTGFAQNVTITPNGITPALSGSYPRLSHDALMALPSPQSGDLAYDETFRCLRLYNKTKWVRLLSDMELNLPSMTAWSAGGKGDDLASSVAVDTLGNVYISGSYSDTTSFGNTDIISAGGYDIFVAKYTNEGVFEWVRHAGGVQNDHGISLKVSKNGNVYLTGSFEGAIDFDGTPLASAGAIDIFLAKFNTNGAMQWVKKAGCSNYGYGNGITLDDNENIYIGGNFTNSAYFDGNTINSSGLYDVFAAKYNSAGNLQWVQRAGGTSNDFGYSIAIDGGGNVYITGYFEGNASFGGVPVSSAGGGDFFIAKYNPTLGVWPWVQRGGSSQTGVVDVGVNITVDISDNVYVTGSFTSTATFSGVNLTSNGADDIFIAKYNSSGSLLWIRSAGGIDIDQGWGVVTDALGNLYVTGFFRQVGTFGHLTVATGGISDTFIAKYLPNGSIQWVQRAGGINIDQGMNIAIDKNNNIYVSGYFRDTNLFGSTPLTSVGDGDIYVTRIKE